MPFPLAAVAAVAPLIGKIFSGAAQGSANQRASDNQQQLLQTQTNNRDALERASLMNQNQTTRAQMANAGALDRATLDLQRKGFQQQEGSAQARQALVGSLLSRIQPAQLSGLSERVSSRMPQMRSIIDAIGPEARQAGTLLQNRGLTGLQNGPTSFSDLPPVSLPDLVTLPPAQIAQMQQSGLLEKIMGGLGIAGSLIGGVQSVVGNGGGSSSLNNAMPSPYTGFDRYGNASTFTLPKDDLLGGG